MLMETHSGLPGTNLASLLGQHVATLREWPSPIGLDCNAARLLEFSDPHWPRKHIYLGLVGYSCFPVISLTYLDQPRAS